MAQEGEAEMTLNAAADFADLIRKGHDSDGETRWGGTFLEYLERVKTDPKIARLSHAHLYDVIMKPGVAEPDPSTASRTKRLLGDDPPKVYSFFKGTFFGIEEPLERLVAYFHSASLQGEESRQLLYLMGPVGAGKSSLIESLKQGLEAADPIYTIEGCPIQEEPLHLIPKRLRPEFETALGIAIEGELCPICRHRVEHEFEGRYEEVPVTTVQFSITGRVGIAVVPPVDPNNQDTSVLIGSEDISKLDQFSEGDPRVLDLNGAFNRGNRGLVEFIEIFKNETEYLHAIITATQEKFIPAPGRHGTVYVDTVILGHSNEAEWQKFKADHTNEAILDRMVTIRIPYNLRLDEEVEIYRKILRRSGFREHIAPHTLEVAALFAILTRLQPTPKCDLMTKLKIYNGEEVVELGQAKRVDISELREDAFGEGMEGVSPRFIMKAIDTALSRSPDGITPIQIRETLVRMVKETDLPDDTRKRYLEFLQDTIHKAYLEILEREITKAFVYAYEEQAETLFQNYLDHAEAYANKTTLRDRNTKEELEPDEAFLKSIEEQIGITGAAAEGFRQEVIAYLWAAGRRGETLTYRAYEPLKEAVEKKLMGSVREISRVITKARTRDEEQREKYDALVQRLLDSGYNEHSAEIILKYAANHLWKD
jgi:serine protein kinase